MLSRRIAVLSDRIVPRRSAVVGASFSIVQPAPSPMITGGVEDSATQFPIADVTLYYAGLRHRRRLKGMGGRPPGSTVGQELSEHFIGRDNRTGDKVGRKVHDFTMSAVSGVGQRNPIEGVSKENGHVGSGGLFRCAVEIVVVFACSVSRQTLEHLRRQGVHAGRERSPERLNILSRSIFASKAADAFTLRGLVFAVAVKAQGFSQDLGNVGVRVETASFGLL